MERDLFNKIVDILTPHMGDNGSRHALVQTALFGTPVLNSINWNGASHTFTVHLVQTLIQYGEYTPGKKAIVAVLETLKRQVGSDKKAKIDGLISRIAHDDEVTGGKNMVVEAAAFAFLLDVGRWAMTELKERWTLRRKEKELELEKLDEEDLEPKVQSVIDELVSSKGEQEVKRIQQLIQRKRDAIYRWRNAKLADQEEYDQQRITKATLENRLAELNSNIERTMREIEMDLRELGFKVEKT